MAVKETVTAHHPPTPPAKVAPAPAPSLAQQAASYFSTPAARAAPKPTAALTPVKTYSAAALADAQALARQVF